MKRSKSSSQEWIRKGLVGAGLVASLSVLAGCGDEEPKPADETPDETETPEAPTDALADTNVVLIRLNADGSIDQSYAQQGIATFDFGAGVSATARDNIYSIAKDASDRIVLFGSRKGEGARIDVDRVVARINVDGTLDTGFGTDGYNVLNTGNLNDNARTGIVLPDGKIVASGYVSQPTGAGTQSANSVVLTRLNADGKNDETFGYKGVANFNPFAAATPNIPWGFAEAYAVGVQQDGKLVTTGYGKPTFAQEKVDMVSFRVDTTGLVDTTWGDAGTVRLSLPVNLEERGRNLVVLPDNRVVIVGSAEPTTAGNVDAMVHVVTAAGAIDTGFAAEGFKLFDFDGYTSSAFFGAAANADGSLVAAVGWQSGKLNDVAVDQDAIIALVSPNGGTDIAHSQVISDVENDRFEAVTFGPDGKIYAVGTISNQGKNQLLVARFNTDGTLDSTFDTEGYKVIDVPVKGDEVAGRGIVVLPDGKIIVGGVAGVP